jgi:hypothetical protein
MKLSLYFLFYVAMVLELLIFIVDRDDAEGRVALATKTMIRQMSSIDTVKMFGTEAFKLGGDDEVHLGYHTFTLISDSERSSIRYELKRTYVYNGDTLLVCSDTTAQSGIESIRKDTLIAMVVEKGHREKVRQRSFVILTFSRNAATGDPVVNLRHELPKKVGRPQENADDSFLDGSVVVQVLPILKRSFPEAFTKNPQLLRFISEEWKVADVDNYWPKCVPWSTTIEFRSTTNIENPGGV